MSEQAARDQFEAQVCQLVEMIPACSARKQAMREELLGHLIGAYEQELNIAGCSETALSAVLARFGNVELVREELRQSVPLAERLIYFFSSPRERLMLRWILVGIAVIAIGMAIVLPALARIKGGEHVSMGGAVMLSIGVALVVLGITTIGFKLVRRPSR
jgi:hypothetical protein